jgi:hypothetical protein
MCRSKAHSRIRLVLPRTKKWKGAKKTINPLDNMLWMRTLAYLDDDKALPGDRRILADHADEHAGEMEDADTLIGGVEEGRG